MTQLASLFPAHILAAAPVPARIIDASDYLDYLLDERPDLHSAALPHARRRLSGPLPCHHRHDNTVLAIPGPVAAALLAATSASTP
ncbi:MAG: hypothetical protein VXW43_14935, partial [Pseudomonadota bacterium]|nr:hypothetical protein [Pseudomonadota bacterium]